MAVPVTRAKTGVLNRGWSLAILGKKVPLSALIFPILHRGRVSHMLYLDNGHKQQAPTDVGEMLILSQRIGQTVEALVERKRKAARG